MKGNLCDFLGVKEGDLLSINDEKLDMHIRIINNKIYCTLDNMYSINYLMSDELSKEICQALIYKGVTTIEETKVMGSNIVI